MKHVNLLEETVREIERYGYSVADVVLVREFDPLRPDDRYYSSCTWDEFEELAVGIYYDPYKLNAINSHLTVVGWGWWLERAEDDSGKSYWHMNIQPQQSRSSFDLLLEEIVKQDFDSNASLSDPALEQEVVSTYAYV